MHSTFVGALAQAFTSDSLGRRGSILVWSGIFTIGTAIQTGTATSIAQITIGRFIAGLGVGALSGMSSSTKVIMSRRTFLTAIVPLYNGETAPKALRGMLLVLYQLQIIFGWVTYVPPSNITGLTHCERIFLSYIIDLGTHTIDGSASWRIPVGLQMLWGLILLSGIFFLPESPYVRAIIASSHYTNYLSSRHLLGIGKEAEARKVVAILNSVPEDDLLVIEVVEELEFGIKAENEGGKATWLECFSTRNALWKRTINGMMLQFIQQLNGQNFYYYYGDTFFASAGTKYVSIVTLVRRWSYFLLPIVSAPTLYKPFSVEYRWPEQFPHCTSSKALADETPFSSGPCSRQSAP